MFSHHKRPLWGYLTAVSSAYKEVIKGTEPGPSQWYIMGRRETSVMSYNKTDSDWI